MEERIQADDRLRGTLETTGMMSFLFGGVIAVILIAGSFEQMGDRLAVAWGQIGFGLLVGLLGWTLFLITAALGRLLERIEELRPPVPRVT